MSKQIEPVEALERFFAVVRQEAVDNPKFAARLLDALGTKVVFRGDAATASVDPLQVALAGYDEFRATFLSFPIKDLKVLVKDFGLATAADMKGKSKAPQIVDVMWAGASAKIKDRGLVDR
jgi:hypothetical protein